MCPLTQKDISSRWEGITSHLTGSGDRDHLTLCVPLHRGTSHTMCPPHTGTSPHRAASHLMRGGRSPHIMYPLTQGDILHEVSPSHRNILSHFVSSHRALPFMGEGKSPHIMCPPHTRISHTGGHLTKEEGIASHVSPSYRRISPCMG